MIIELMKAHHKELLEIVTNISNGLDATKLGTKEPSRKMVFLLANLEGKLKYHFNFEDQAK